MLNNLGQRLVSNFILQKLNIWKKKKKGQSKFHLYKSKQTPNIWPILELGLYPVANYTRNIEIRIGVQN